MKTKTTIIILIIFSIAMGYMESAVVVYLREIFYPEGFSFPLTPISNHLVLVEILREAATLIMLITIAMLTGRTKTERFGFFIFCFGIWDITYYVVLYLILGWPSSLFTWDILFLIPVTWVGPVIGPIINSVSMILLAMLISCFTSAGANTRINKHEWLLFVAGSIVVIISYTEDYMSYMLTGFFWTEILFPSDSSSLMEYALEYIPQSFAWWIFFIGKASIVSGIILFYYRNKKALKN